MKIKIYINIFSPLVNGLSGDVQTILDDLSGFIRTFKYKKSLKEKSEIIRIFKYLRNK